MIGLVRRHPVAVGELPMDDRVKVRECAPERPIEFSRAVLVRSAPRLRCVVDEVVGEEFFEDFEVPPALYLIRVPAADRLRGLARIAALHDCLPIRSDDPSPAHAARPAWARSCCSQTKAMPVPPECETRT